MFTIIFYNSILLCSTFFVWLGDRCRSRIERILLLCTAFFIIFLPSALRYGIGTDFFEYIDIYKNLDDSAWREQGFYFVNLFLRSLDADPQWMIAVLALIFTLVAFWGFPEKNRWKYFFIFMLVEWFLSLNQIRQAISISFSILAFRFFLEKRIVAFTLALIVGGSFHQSILILIPIGYISKIQFPNFVQKNLIPYALCLIIVFMFFYGSLVFEFSEELLRYFGLNIYADYFNSAIHFIEKDYGTSIGFYAKILFCLFVIICIKNTSVNNELDRFVIYLFFGYGVFSALAERIVIFDRMQSVFIVALICGLPIFLERISSNRYKKIIVYMFILLLAATFAWHSVGVASTYADPMRNPYKSMFNK